MFASNLCLSPKNSLHAIVGKASNPSHIIENKSTSCFSDFRAGNKQAIVRVYAYVARTRLFGLIYAW